MPAVLMAIAFVLFMYHIGLMAVSEGEDESKDILNEIHSND